MFGPYFACAGLRIVDVPAACHKHRAVPAQQKDMSMLVCRGAAAGVELLDNTQLGAAAAWIHLQLCFTCTIAKCNHDE